MNTSLVFESDMSQRLDAYLAEALENVTRSKIKNWCKAGEVLVDGKPRKSSHTLRGGETIEIKAVAEPVLDHIEPEDIPLDVIFEDEAIIIINKAPGMVVHPGAGVHSGTLVNALVYHFEHLSQQGGAIRPGIVHRLDKGTTGLMVVAKTDAAHQGLSNQWQAGEVTKVYQTLVWGVPDPPNGEIETYIGRHARYRHRMTAERAGGKWAKTRYKTVHAMAEGARVNVHILTGRTHQVRVHMAHLGHPVIGDAMYGGTHHSNLAKIFDAMPDRPMLHAALLRFNHPLDGKPMTFKKGPPDTFLACEAMLRAWKK